MARVVFSHEEEDDTFIHQFRNFGEDVWRAFREEERMEVSLSEIDRCTDRFEVATKPALVRRVMDRVQPILKQHFMEDRVRVKVLDG